MFDFGFLTFLILQQGFHPTRGATPLFYRDYDGWVNHNHTFPGKKEI